MDPLRALGVFFRLYAVLLVLAATVAVAVTVFPRVVPAVSSPVFAGMWYLVVGVGLAVLFLTGLTIRRLRGA